MSNPRDQIEPSTSPFYRVYGYQDKWKSGPLHLSTSPLRSQGAVCGYHDDTSSLRTQREPVTHYDIINGYICRRCLAAAQRRGWDAYTVRAQDEHAAKVAQADARARHQRRAEPVVDSRDWHYALWLAHTRARLGQTIAWTVRATAHRIVNADTGAEC